MNVAILTAMYKYQNVNYQGALSIQCNKTASNREHLQGDLVSLESQWVSLDAI